MPKLEMHNLTDLLASTHFKVKFHATDDLRGECEITLTDPKDVQVLHEFLGNTLKAWRTNNMSHVGVLISTDAP